MTIRILLTDDHQMVRDGLRVLLEKQPDLEVVGEAADGREAVRLAAELKPHLVIMDLTMPGLNGMAATRQVLEANDQIKVLVLSMHADRRFLADTLSAGAAGYVLKDNAFEELVKAIRAVMAGQIFLSPQATHLMVEDFSRRIEQGDRQLGPALSEREREVLQLLAEGYSTKEIAEQLRVSAKTIETYRAQLMTKLKLDNIATLTKYAIRAGLTAV